MTVICVMVCGTYWISWLSWFPWFSCDSWDSWISRASLENERKQKRVLFTSNPSAVNIIAAFNSCSLLQIA